ncbi:hypothetical protein BASA81_003771 [Batrachochytrium salamandrivorans]|nr:hypothetical protein BASA81_003771 [Batrachochytrium salamandrivorans]
MEPNAATRARDLLQQASRAASGDEAKVLSRQAYSSLRDARDAETDVQLKSVLSLLVDHHRDAKRGDFSSPKPASTSRLRGGGEVEVAKLPDLAYVPLAASQFSNEPWTNIRPVKHSSLRSTSTELDQFQTELLAEKERVLGEFAKMKHEFHDRSAQFELQTKTRLELQALLASEEKDRQRAEAQLKRAKQNLYSVWGKILFQARNVWVQQQRRAGPPVRALALGKAPRAASTLGTTLTVYS